jgi:hypothetical protein
MAEPFVLTAFATNVAGDPIVELLVGDEIVTCALAARAQKNSPANWESFLNVLPQMGVAN